MIAGQTFENFQEMYQRAVKVARVLEATEQENRPANFRKRKIEFGNWGPRRGNMKWYNTGRSQEKGKQPASWQGRPLCKNCGKSHVGPCAFEPIRCYGCGAMGHKANNYPKAAWNQERTMPGTGSRNLPVQAPHGRPPISGPANKNFRKPQAEGRVYHIEAEEDVNEDPHAVVSGTFLVNTLPTRILFDTSTTYSFINPTTVKDLLVYYMRWVCSYV